MAVVAGIDLGTNTVRLLVARFEDRVPGGAPPQQPPAPKFEELYAEQRITRLGQDLRKEGRLVPEAMERTAAALKDFSMAMERFPVDRAAIIATSAVRDAANREEFVELIRRATGHEVQVISGDEEARLSYRGVRLALDEGTDDVMIVDIGGGSTEYVSVRETKITGAVSINMGVVHFTEGHLRSDPPTPSGIAAVRKEVRRRLADEAGMIEGYGEKVSFVGTAGTVTTLAAIHQCLSVYDPAKINNYAMTRAEISGIFDRLRAMTLAQRRRLPGLSPGREDLIIAGTIILLESMEHFGFDRMIVSDYGLREGLVADLSAAGCEGASNG